MRHCRRCGGAGRWRHFSAAVGRREGNGDTARCIRAGPLRLWDMGTFVCIGPPARIGSETQEEVYSVHLASGGVHEGWAEGLWLSPVGSF